jgi:hypothetical protein
MFDKNAETLINWFENLEERCRKLIFEKRDAWFQNSLDENDIETAFNSIIRIYKSGKYYLVRTGVKNDNNGLPSVKIYNENEIPLTIEDIKAESNIISILEIQGVKFTSRNFQIEIELKQAMALNCEPVFNSCLIKKDKKILQEPVVNSLEAIPIIESLGSLEEVEPQLEEVKEETLEPVLPDINEEPQEITLEFEELDENIDDNNEIKEIKELNNNDLNLETMQLKKPNQVYYELYKEARKKAKLAKKNAIIAYLEAKNIKKTYMIENLNDSDSDIDDEIDDVSESELEGL